MSTIQQDELYEHLSEFLKGKGILFQEGAYTQRVRRGCALLTEAINLTQQTVEKAKVEIDAKLEQMRQLIHEQTAPRPASAPGAAARSAGPGQAVKEPVSAAPEARQSRKPPRKRKSSARRQSRARA